MGLIPLTKGYEAIVDDEDYEWLSAMKWRPYIRRLKSGEYVMARRSGPGKSVILMHREILCAAKGAEVDHINGNPLDNRRSNLRICSHQENIVSRRNIPRSGKYRGVKKNQRGDKWTAYITAFGNRVSLGSSFATAEDAALAYNAAASRLFGSFAYLNITPDHSAFSHSRHAHSVMEMGNESQ